jgi:glutathione S-transferase
MWDRIFDNYVQGPMQKIVGDRLRPDGEKDRFGVEEAMAQLGDIYGVLEQSLGSKTWMLGDDFTLADCSAAPALLYADTLVPFGEAHAGLTAYLDRLKERPSFARVLAEAKPYFNLFPMERKPRIGPSSRLQTG